MEDSEIVGLTISLAADACEARQFGDRSLLRPGTNLKGTSY